MTDRRSTDPLSPAAPDAPLESESSMQLIERARAGDSGAVNALMKRYLPRLRRWAAGRLPRWARDMADTEDLVQDSLLRTFTKLETVEIRGEGALQAYIRQSALNRIRDEIRRVGRRPVVTGLDTQQPAAGASPLEEAIGEEALQRYDRALGRLRPQEREALIARIEMGFDNEEIAHLLGKRSANAARMAVERALLRLAEEMKRGE